MKTIAATASLALALSWFAGSALAGAESDDPCENENHENQMRECYAREQARVSAEADALAKKIAADLRKDAQDPEYRGFVAKQLQKASSAVAQSQRTWKVYREEHCEAVKFSYTNGSGAQTAYEGCLFGLGMQRLRDLRDLAMEYSGSD